MTELDAGRGALVLGGSALMGAVAFQDECASCHAARDGFDLALFSFSDTTIVRRALGHVDYPTAADIVAHVRSLTVSPLPDTTRLFQPRGYVLGGDYEFAVELFGADEWPSDLTVEDLRAIDVLQTSVAVKFPIWSVEENSRDWMPEQPLADGILDHAEGRARRALDDFYGMESVSSLATAVDAIRDAERDPSNPAAPCVKEPMERLRPVECFEARRWASTLGAQYMLRRGLQEPLHRDIHRIWWDVGNVARRSLSPAAAEPVEDGLDNWVSWMWMGWAFEPGVHASVYLARGLDRQGLPRHATFHILKAQVERPPRSMAAYRDLRNVAVFAPDRWLMNAMVFGFESLIQRLDAGHRPVDERVAEAVAEVERAFEEASGRVSGPEVAVLRGLRDRVLARLD